MWAGQNQFASGGLLLMIIGGVSVYLREVPERLWHWFIRKTTMLVTVKDDDAAFFWVKEWFLEQEFLKRMRQVDIDTTVRNERVALVPAPGMHWFWYRRRPFQVWFSRSESKREYITRRIESFTFRTIGRNQVFVREFIDDVVQCHTKRLGVQSSLFTYNDGWELVEGYMPRILDSIVLTPGDKDGLITDIARFRESKGRYAQLGIPYHRGYLLYGPPGTGKTSLVSALGGHFGLSIYVVNLGALNDRTLLSAVNQVPSQSLLLFEDIDCMTSDKTRNLTASDGVMEADPRKQEKERTDPNAVTLSGLLNVLDGVYAPSGVLFVMTTNRVEALDAALLRPGRIDYELYLGEASEQQKLELYRRFFPHASEVDAREFVSGCSRAETMAEFQGLLLGLEQRDEASRPEALPGACFAIADD